MLKQATVGKAQPPVERELLSPDFDEGDATPVPEELEGQPGLQPLPMMGTVEWSNRRGSEPKAETKFRPEYRPRADAVSLAPIRTLLPGGGGEGPPLTPGATSASPSGSSTPLSSVLRWMELANLEEAPPAVSSRCPASRGHSRVLCLGEPLNSGPDIELLRTALSSEADFLDENRHCLGVPSDEESRPRPPPYAAHVALVRWSDSELEGSLPLKSDSEDSPQPSNDRPRAPLVSKPRSASSNARPEGSLPLECAPKGPTEVVDREEDEWIARKALTGAIGKLVHYPENSTPSADVLGLRRTRYGRIKVTSLQQNGLASSAGVEIGDQLISIDGVPPSESRLAEVIRTSIPTPSTLIFMGFAGKLQAEVRVRQPDEPKCGLPHFTDVARCAQSVRLGSCVEVCDTVVFKQAAASLFLQVDTGQADGKQSAQQLELPQSPPTAMAPYSLPRPNLHARKGATAGEAEATEPAASAGAPEDPGAPSRVYELQREEAKRIVMDALHAEASRTESSPPGGFRALLAHA